MKINLLSSFAAGMLITTTVCGAVYLSGKSDTAPVTVKSSAATSTVKVQPTEKEMKQKLESMGYVVQSKAELDKQKQDAKASTATTTAAPKAQETPQPVTNVVVNVTEGMTSIDVGRILQSSNLVKDAFAFSKNIEGRGLEKKLRPGVYNVNSKMTYNEMVATIFK